MMWYLLLLLFPLGYGTAYLVHCVKKKQPRAAVGTVLLLALTAASGALLLYLSYLS